jgi:hypothetical protein
VGGAPRFGQNILTQLRKDKVIQAFRQAQTQGRLGTAVQNKQALGQSHRQFGKVCLSGNTAFSIDTID